MCIFWAGLSVGLCDGLITLGAMHAAYKSALFITVGKILAYGARSELRAFPGLQLVFHSKSDWRQKRLILCCKILVPGLAGY